MFEELETLRESNIVSFSGIPKDLTSAITEEWSDPNWVLWRLGDCPESNYDFEAFAAANPCTAHDSWQGFVSESYLSDAPFDGEMSPLAKVWQELFGDDVVIPYDPDERRAKFPKAYEELAEFIGKHERMKAKKSG